MHVGLIARGDAPWALELAGDLHDAGLKVSLYLNRRHILNEVGSAESPGERLHEIGLVPRECPVRVFDLPRRSDPRSLPVFLGMKRAIVADGVDLAHIVMGPDELWLAILGCLLRSIPVTSTMVVPQVNHGDAVPGAAVWTINRLSVFGSDVITVPSRQLVPRVAELYGMPPHRVAFVPVTLGQMALRWETARQAEEPATVLFFGRAHPHKGLEYLIRAQPQISAAVPEARILISAHGEHLQSCVRRIEHPSAFEIHEGLVPGDRLAAIFRRSTVVALPYLSASSSGVLLTAQAFGKPVVVSDIDGLSEYVEDRVSGLLVPAGDVEALASALIELLGDRGLRNTLGRGALKAASDRKRESTEMLLRAYQTAAAEHRGAGSDRSRERKG